MRRTLVALLTLLVVAPAARADTVLVLGTDGEVGTREDRHLPPPEPRPPRTARRTTTRPRLAARRTVRGELRRLLDAGAIDQASHDAWRRTYADALALRRRLRGARRAELGAVIREVERLAAGGDLTATRAPLAFEVLERNRQWWRTGPLLGWGRRIAFAGSQLVWQAYPGQGLQLQWLGTFGKANALFKAREDEALLELLDEAAPLAARRAGGLAFEALFPFGAASAPWVSAITQGTAVQAFARAAVRFREPSFFRVARAATAPLAARPPAGVRVAGDHLLMYSSAPRLRILNGFVQALNGLHDFAGLANDDPARRLFAAAEARLRAELPRYDTGAWTLYHLPGREADLGYHTLQRDFLRGLCSRLRKRPLADPAPYCNAAARFTAYLRLAPQVAVDPRPLRRRRPGAIHIELDKVSVVTLVVRRRGRVVLRRVARLGAGHRTFPVTPRRAAPLEVEVRATDLAGNDAAASATVPVRR